MKHSRIVISLCLALGAMPMFASAQITSIRSGLDASARSAGITATSCRGTECLTRIAGNVIGIAFGLTGILLLGLFLWGGFLWMTAGGEKGNVEKAMLTIRNAVAGLVIVGVAYAGTSYILEKLGEAIGGSGTTEQPGSTAPRAVEIGPTGGALPPVCGSGRPDGTFVTGRPGVDCTVGGAVTSIFIMCSCTISNPAATPSPITVGPTRITGVCRTTPACPDWCRAQPMTRTDGTGIVLPTTVTPISCEPVPTTGL